MLRDIEGTHELLYRAHWDLASAANHIHAAIQAIHAAGRYADARNKLAGALQDLENARNLADAASTAAGNGRTELIRQTGCDGTCSDRARAQTASSADELRKNMG